MSLSDGFSGKDLGCFGSLQGESNGKFNNVKLLPLRDGLAMQKLPQR